MVDCAILSQNPELLPKHSKYKEKPKNQSFQEHHGRNLEVDEGSGIREELDSGQTRTMKTRVVDGGGGIMEELDSGQTTTIETGAGKEILTFAEEGELKFGKDVVTKNGKATGTTYGYLINDILSIKMEISPMISYKVYNCYTINNTNDDDPFFLEGDSGSGVYVLENSEPTKPLGIAFALTKSYLAAAVCDISKIVETLGLQIVRFKKSKSSETLTISEKTTEEKSNEPMGMS